MLGSITQLEFAVFNNYAWTYIVTFERNVPQM